MFWKSDDDFVESYTLRIEYTWGNQCKGEKLADIATKLTNTFRIVTFVKTKQNVDVSGFVFRCLREIHDVNRFLGNNPQLDLEFGQSVVRCKIVFCVKLGKSTKLTTWQLSFSLFHIQTLNVRRYPCNWCTCATCKGIRFSKCGHRYNIHCLDLLFISGPVSCLNIAKSCYCTVRGFPAITLSLLW